MYQQLIDRADRRLRAVWLAKCIIVGGPLLSLVVVVSTLAGCGHRDDGLGYLYRAVPQEAQQ